jgi:hypothetical protein
VEALSEETWEDKTRRLEAPIGSVIGDDRTMLTHGLISQATVCGAGSGQAESDNPLVAAAVPFRVRVPGPHSALQEDHPPQVTTHDTAKAKQNRQKRVCVCALDGTIGVDGAIISMVC